MRGQLLEIRPAGGAEQEVEVLLADLAVCHRQQLVEQGLRVAHATPGGAGDAGKHLLGEGHLLASADLLQPPHDVIELDGPEVETLHS